MRYQQTHTISCFLASNPFRCKTHRGIDTIIAANTGASDMISVIDFRTYIKTTRMVQYACTWIDLEKEIQMTLRGQGLFLKLPNYLTLKAEQPKALNTEPLEDLDDNHLGLLFSS